jgi:hypothetical protein
VIVGEKSEFAIESELNVPLANIGQRGLGFFVIYIKGRMFGVREEDATMLACSFEAVARRVANAGSQTLDYVHEKTPLQRVVDSVQRSLYDVESIGDTFFDVSSDKFRADVYKSGVLWAPDGDEAFDDGGHVLQFDFLGSVRLIGFVSGDKSDRATGVFLPSLKYYSLLRTWLSEFEASCMRN